VDKELPWEVVGTRYDDGKLTQIHLRRRRPIRGPEGVRFERATIRVKDGALLVERDP
jgi:hypothetical protein